MTTETSTAIPTRADFSILLLHHWCESHEMGYNLCRYMEERTAFYKDAREKRNQARLQTQQKLVAAYDAALAEIVRLSEENYRLRQDADAASAESITAKSPAFDVADATLAILSLNDFKAKLNDLQCNCTTNGVHSERHRLEDKRLILAAYGALLHERDRLADDNDTRRVRPSADAASGLIRKARAVLVALRASAFVEPEYLAAMAILTASQVLAAGVLRLIGRKR